MRGRIGAGIGLALLFVSVAPAQTVDEIERRPPTRQVGELRDPVRLQAMIERFDEARASGDVLPLHALDLALRKAVDGELLVDGDRSERTLALRLERAAGIGNAEEARVRHDLYRTPLQGRAAAQSAPSGPTKQAAGREADPDLERRRKGVIRELSRLEPHLDDDGVEARRALLLQLLAIAREAEAPAP